MDTLPEFIKNVSTLDVAMLIAIILMMLYLIRSDFRDRKVYEAYGRFRSVVERYGIFDYYYQQRIKKIVAKNGSFYDVDMNAIRVHPSNYNVMYIYGSRIHAKDFMYFEKYTDAEYRQLTGNVYFQYEHFKIHMFSHVDAPNFNVGETRHVTYSPNDNLKYMLKQFLAEVYTKYTEKENHVWGTIYTFNYGHRKFEFEMIYSQDPKISNRCTIKCIKHEYNVNDLD